MSKTYPVERSPIEDLPGESISLGEGITLQRGAIMRRGVLVPGESISFGGGITLERGAIMRPGVPLQEITDLSPEVLRAQRKIKVRADRASARTGRDLE